MKTTTQLRRALLLTALGIVASCAQPAAAGEIIDKDVPKVVEASKKAPQGWRWHVNLGSSTSMTHNRRVVGSQDGFNFTLGVLADFSTAYRAGSHEWTLSASLAEALTKTPSIDLFIKTQDEFKLATAYLYHFESLGWLAAFVDVSMTTQVLPGYDARAADVTVRRIATDGSHVDEAAAAQTRIDLTDPFEPLRLKEVVGLDARPIERDAFSAQFRLGAGTVQLFSRGGYVESDNGDTPELELVQIESYQQVGAEAQAHLGGHLNELVTWSTDGTFFQPLYSTLHRSLSGIDLLTIDLAAKLSVKLSSWASLDYVLTARRDPLVLDDWQVQNAVLLTAGFERSSTPKNP